MLEQKLKKIGKELDDLAIKGERLKGDARTEFNVKMLELKQKRDQAREKIEQLKDSGGEVADTIKDGLDDVMEDLKKTYEKVAARMN